MTAQAFKDPWPKANPIEAYQDESVQAMHHRVDWKIFRRTFRLLKENPNTNYQQLADELTDMLTELMGK